MVRTLNTRFYGFLKLLPTFVRLDTGVPVDLVSIAIIEGLSEGHARGKLLQFLCGDCVDEFGNDICTACWQLDKFFEFDCETEDGFVSALYSAGAEKSVELSNSLILDLIVLTYDDNIENIQFYKNTYKEILEGKVNTLVFQNQEYGFVLEMDEDSEDILDLDLLDLDEVDLDKEW